MIPRGELFEQKMTLVHFVPSRTWVTLLKKERGRLTFCNSAEEAALCDS